MLRPPGGAAAALNARGAEPYFLLFFFVVFFFAGFFVAFFFAAIGAPSSERPFVSMEHPRMDKLCGG
jgi:hypothetical protein